MVNKEDLLTTLQMAEFAANGVLRFDELIGPDLSKAILDELNASGHGTHFPAGIPLSETWPAEHPFGQLIRHPKVVGIIHSMVGPNCRYDHHAAHTTRPGSDWAQPLHQDAEWDPRFTTFDIQLSFFPADTTLEMGGTRFLPGSQFRRVNESTIGRYQHIVGMQQTVCKAGTLAVWHTNVWHGAQPNKSDTIRYMWKLRLNPVVKQQLLWNTDDLAAPEIGRVLGTPQRWYGQTARVEMFNRARFWRSMTANPDFDLGFWLGRIENEPTAVYKSQLVSPR